MKHRTPSGEHRAKRSAARSVPLPRVGARRVLCTFVFLLSLLAMAASLQAELTIATVGDSLADAVYLGIKSQPQLVKDNGIHLIRWSRPSIGLTRVDFFDYPGWLRTSKNLGRVDFCVVE